MILLPIMIMVNPETVKAFLETVGIL